MIFCVKHNYSRLDSWPLIILILFASFVSYVVPIHIFNQKAYADGLTQETYLLLFICKGIVEAHGGRM